VRDTLDQKRTYVYHERWGVANTEVTLNFSAKRTEIRPELTLVKRGTGEPILSLPRPLGPVDSAPHR
jgi:hypothetical protein